jgi:hypothetical protein
MVSGAYWKLTILTLTALPRIDVPLLSLISRTFPRLIDLYLSSTERLDLTHCWDCFQESLSCTDHSPIPEQYGDADLLVVSHPQSFMIIIPSQSSLLAPTLYRLPVRLPFTFHSH